MPWEDFAEFSKTTCSPAWREECTTCGEELLDQTQSLLRPIDRMVEGDESFTPKGSLTVI